VSSNACPFHRPHACLQTNHALCSGHPKLWFASLSIPIEKLISYTDVDWGGCPNTHRTTSGYCLFLGDNLISWSSKRQPTLPRSSAEAKYKSVANVVSELCWLHNLLSELHHPLSHATLVYCDDVSVISLSCNPVQHQCTKHIEMNIHFVREKVVCGQTRVLHVPSHHQIADIFTKGLPQVFFDDFHTSLSVRVMKYYPCPILFSYLCSRVILVVII